MKIIYVFKIIFLSALINILPIYTSLNHVVLSAEIFGEVKLYSRSSKETFDYVGVEVELYNNNEFVYSDITNEQGSFSIYDIPIGDYKLKIDGEFREITIDGQLTQIIRIDSSNYNERISIKISIIE